MYTRVKKKTLLPIIIVLVAAMLCLPVFANALCIVCQGYSPAYCTGKDTSGSYTHYEHTFLGWGWGWECNYYLYRHWVATTCCNGDLGGHIYKESEHSYCGAVEKPMACSEVPDWVMDP